MFRAWISGPFLLLYRKEKEMKRKRDFQTFVLRMMRRAGMLCKKPQPERPRIRVSKSVLPDGSEVKLPPVVMKEELVNPAPFKSEVHIWIESKKAALKDCKFDSEAGMCICGIDLDDFASKGCNKNKKKK